MVACLPWIDLALALLFAAGSASLWKRREDQVWAGPAAALGLTLALRSLLWGAIEALVQWQLSHFAPLPTTLIGASEMAIVLLTCLAAGALATAARRLLREKGT